MLRTQPCGRLSSLRESQVWLSGQGIPAICVLVHWADVHSGLPPQKHSGHLLPQTESQHCVKPAGTSPRPRAVFHSTNNPRWQPGFIKRSNQHTYHTNGNTQVYFVRWYAGGKIPNGTPRRYVFCSANSGLMWPAFTLNSHHAGVQW